MPKQRASLAENVEGAAKRRGIELSDLLPLDFYDVREEITPRAPSEILIRWGLLTYSVFLVVFLALFATEITKVSTTSDTTIQAEPIIASDTSCSPLSTFVGSTDVMCASSPSLPNYDRFSVQSDPYGEGFDGFVTCGSFVRATRTMCLERSADVCHGYKQAIEERSTCRVNPGDSSLTYLNWSNGQMKTIRREVNFDPVEVGVTDFLFLDEYTGPFPGGKSIYTVSQNSLSFGLAYSLGSHTSGYVNQDGTGPVSGEGGAPNCGVSDLWLSDCAAFWQSTCDRVGIVSGPYACTKTTTTTPGLFEALGTAYANLALFSSIVLPAVAYVMVKVEEKKKKSSDAREKGELVGSL